jgi:hypothetical protein
MIEKYYEARYTRTYFIKCHHYVKIGRSDAPEGRRIQLQAGCPYKLKLIGESRLLEQDIQKEFGHLKMQGEWYLLSDELKKFIDENKLDGITELPPLMRWLRVGK